MQNKVSVIGAGNVGASCALFAAQQGLGDIVLTDIVEGLPQGKALDMLQCGSPLDTDISITGTNDYKDIEGSDVVIVTAGLARKPGMDRLDLLKKNAEICGGIAEAIKTHAPDAVVIVVSNPIDVMVYHTFKVTGFPKERVIGQAGVLDSSRCAAFIAMELGVAVTDIQAMVLGGHGDTMVPLPRYTTVSGVPITELIPKDRIDAISERTQKGGGEIVNLLKTGSAYYAPAASSVKMAASILNDTHHVLPCSAYLEGEYGLNDVYVGVPCQLGRKGLEKIIELDLTEDEKNKLHSSAGVYKESLKDLGY
ncbi:MAG: malate dehydrogenase [Candidatus Omnitrophica bacterium]|nr:malate dehydrogenase [Candidatus Omnitrophota bacterium]MCA9418112.1 malate dehydrogenase [Candidatus Omnitrophota bacterium]MCA9425365.1 malate dehydrogenase [Candidatus Omnitrophota bacterium]MCA9436567.1 malate dehydrogenase [Candidatus Omnitrophota bacterium]MCA9442527.1 malate dehydrogenase [Candidatus Omnitrophota bacterium]